MAVVNANLNEVLKNKKFVQEILKKETGEQVRKALAEKGVTIGNDEDLSKLASIMIEAFKESDKSFLKDDELEKCVGGVMAININEISAIAREIGPTEVCWAMKDESGKVIIK